MPVTGRLKRVLSEVLGRDGTDRCVLVSSSFLRDISKLMFRSSLLMSSSIIDLGTEGILDLIIFVDPMLWGLNKSSESMKGFLSFLCDNTELSMMFMVSMRTLLSYGAMILFLVVISKG